MTTLNQPLGIRGPCESTIQQVRWAECKCSMHCNIQGMLKMRELFSTFQTGEGEWEKSRNSGSTPCVTKLTKVRQYPKARRLAMQFVDWTPSRYHSWSLQHYVFLTKHGDLSTVPLKLDNILLYLHIRLVIPTGPANSPAVRVWTPKMVRFGSRTV